MIKLKPGFAFSEHIKTEKLPRRSKTFSSYEIGRESNLRNFVLPVILFIFLGTLVFRLFYVQVVQGSYYKELADNNRIHTQIIHAPRGVIFDRNNVPLVFNIPGFRQMVDGKPQFVSEDNALSLLSHGEKNLEIDSLRKYSYADVAAHVLGYVGEITKEELGYADFSSYKPGDVVGKYGIEQQYESLLAGTDGKELAEVDAMGKKVRTLGQIDPIAGSDITLTLDIKLQQAAYKALEGIQKGVVIVSTPQGEILALVSKPSFDPNLFTLGKDYKPTTTDSAYTSVSQVILDNENQPFLNRAIAGAYPPGSTFKLVTAASALENKKIDENFEVDDTGILKIGDFSFANWYFTEYGRTEGLVNVIKAIKRSNDIFFYKVANMVGVDLLSATARQFGLGKQLGIDLPGEAKGLVPDEAWKKKTLGEQWYLGDNYHYGIGQGYLLTTPLQVNMLTSVIANEGILYKPHLLKNLKFEIKNLKFLSKKTISLIRQGMIESCAPSGVAWPLFDFKVINPKLKIDGKNILAVPEATTSAAMQDFRRVVVACKTGTAQHGDDKTLPHAWITLFAPAYNPQIVVTVLAESSGEGSNIAGPIAKKVLDAWFTAK